MEKGHTQVSVPNCDPRHWGREKSLPKLQIWMKIDECFCFKALYFGGVFFWVGRWYFCATIEKWKRDTEVSKQVTWSRRGKSGLRDREDTTESRGWGEGLQCLTRGSGKASLFQFATYSCFPLLACQLVHVTTKNWQAQPLSLLVLSWNQSPSPRIKTNSLAFPILSFKFMGVNK